MSRILTGVRLQHLIITGAGSKPTVPSPATLTPSDAGWVATDILRGEWAYNQTDDVWYYRTSDDRIISYIDIYRAADWSTSWDFSKLTYLAAHTATGNLEILIDGTSATVNGGTFATITLDGTQSLTFRGDGIAYTLGGDMTENGETLAAGTYTVVALWGNDSVSISVALVNESGTLALGNSAPVASSVAISGTVAVGQTLTGSYTYTDADGDTESGSTFVWQRSDDGLTGWANISAATATTYQVQSADELKYLRFGVTPSDGEDAGTQAFSAATIQVPDATAPTFSNVSVSSVTGTTASFNAQINEAGTIFWAVYPTETAQQTKAAIEAGTGAVDFDSIATAGGTIETDSITGLDDETAYKVHYFGRDTAGNESTATLTSEFTTGDATAPTLTAASIENATPNQLDLTFDEATTITTAGWSMSASGGAVTIDSIVSGSGTTDIVAGLSRSIANGETVTISYNPATGATTDGSGNELATITDQAVTNNVAGSIIIMSDDFTGTTIDTNKWTVTNPNSPYPSITQNNTLLCASTQNQGTSTYLSDNIVYKNTIQTGVMAIDFVSNSNLNYTGVQFGFFVDVNNRIVLAPKATTGKMRFFVIQGGTTHLAFDPGTIDAFNNRWKITIDGSNNIKAFYWSGASWTQFGPTQTYDIGTNKEAGLIVQNSNVISGTVSVDDFVLTSEDYATENP